MRVLFAPDFRAGVPYQQFLADALAAEGVTVEFLTHYRRLLPLTRGAAGFRAPVLHLHWPEAYFASNYRRLARYLPDLWLATRRRRFILTAHNLFPHEHGDRPAVRFVMRQTYRRAHRVIAHSAAAAALLERTFGVAPERLVVIPHGDLAVDLPRVDRAAARAALGLDGSPVCLVFGVAEPYKGLEEMIAGWAALRPAAGLHIVGRAADPAYRAHLTALARDIPGVRLHLQWQEPGGLARWLAAADCTLFNYRASLTSGAACLARSLGLPILLPARLPTIDLMEPHPLVRRFTAFDASFRSALDVLLAGGPDPAAAADWRAATAWPRIAALTAPLYRNP